MSARSYCLLAAAIFAVVGLVQLVRAVMGWPILINGISIPVWASWIMFAIAGLLSALGWRAADRL